MKVLKVWRAGPRFWVRLIEDQGRLKVKKELIAFEDPWAKGALLKEAAFFRWGNTVKDEKLKAALPRLLESKEEEGEIWYMREFHEGHFQNKNPSRFILKESFYSDISPERIVDFLERLHHSSRNLPTFLTEHFSTYTLSGFEHFTAWEKLPLEILNEKDREKIRKLLEEKRAVFNAHQNVLCHYEFYGTHLLLTSGKKLKIIDWENVGWGNVTHDLTTLYLRTYSHPDWQERLLKSFREKVDPSTPFEDLFEIELLLQSTGNIRHFLTTREPLEVKERPRALNFFLAQVKEILAKVN